MSETVLAASSTVLNRASWVTTASGQTHQTHDDLGDDSQRPLRTDQQASQISAGLVYDFPLPRRYHR